MTELNCEQSKLSPHIVDNKGIAKVVLIYSLLVVSLGVILNSDLLFGYLGMLTDTVQPVINNMINHCPVEVKMPVIPMGPSWNGSGSNI
ncbi:nuclease [Yersinia sp. Marseille-Q3913]|uniref:E492 group microcin n=1 Tax=Yersinia sp. Marseille-Q3913 TaxID=2830769 RepID=UPI001BB00CBE|nr:nuclease [Yersinia sp. Marseille-Q3913]MBS0057334.1 nuclease [Yersinia sp. Marseille-Q3913]